MKAIHVNCSPVFQKVEVDLVVDSFPSFLYIYQWVSTRFRNLSVIYCVQECRKRKMPRLYCHVNSTIAIISIYNNLREMSSCQENTWGIYSSATTHNSFSSASIRIDLNWALNVWSVASPGATVGQNFEIITFPLFALTVAAYICRIAILCRRVKSTMCIFVVVPDIINDRVAC